MKKIRLSCYFLHSYVLVNKEFLMGQLQDLSENQSIPSKTQQKTAQKR